jgi:DNA-binding transcriptional LysR family regulator
VTTTKPASDDAVSVSIGGPGDYRVGCVELRQLRLFVALAEELHFGRAAAREHLTQPAFSRQIKDLERSLGVELFTRTSRRVELTGAGRELLPRARRLLSDAQEALASVRRTAAGGAGRLRLGYTVLPPREILTSFLTAAEKADPEIRLEIETLWWSEQIEGVLNGSIDVAFVGGPPEDRRLAWHALLEEPLVGVLPPGAAPPGPLRLSDVVRLPAVTLPRWIAPGAFDAIQALLNSSRITERLAETTEHSVTRELVAAGRALTVVPASIAREWDDVSVHAILPAPPPIVYGAAWRRDRELPVLEAALSRMTLPGRSPAPA